MHKYSKNLKKLINKHFSLFIYILCLSVSLIVLYQGRQDRLFPLPSEDMDQFTALKEAVRIYHKHYIHKNYMLSPGYTVFLALLVLISNGKLIFIRILQVCVASLIPVLIYKLSRHFRFNFKSSQLAALLYCFYGPAILISISLLRASLLALCFISLIYFLVLGFKKKNIYYFILAGFFAALTVLGRENFIPIICMPLCLLILKYFRTSKNIKKFAIVYIISAITFLLPCLLYNYFNYGSFAIIPGNLNNVVSCYHGEGLEGLKEKDYFQKFMINIPLQFIKFISSYEIPNSLSFYAHQAIIPILKFMFITFNAILITACIGFFLNLKNKGIILTALLICSYVATMLYFEMFYRFRIPVVPLLFVLIAGSIQKFKLLNLNKQVLIILISFSLFFITYTNPQKLIMKNEKIGVATVLIKNKRLHKAENYMNENLNNSNSYSKLWLQLSTEYYQQKDYTSAARTLEVYKNLLKNN